MAMCVIALRPAEAGDNDQCLTEWMRMPRGPRTRLERDACTTNTCRFSRLKQWINAHCAGKPVRRALHVTAAYQLY
jgi:hypothetical protein